MHHAEETVCTVCKRWVAVILSQCFEPQPQTEYMGWGRGGGNRTLRKVVYCQCSCNLDSKQMRDYARVTEELQQAVGAMGAG